MTSENSRLLTHMDKSFPARAVGMSTTEFLATEPHLSEFWTPIVALDDAAMRHNVMTMATWCREKGIDLMPHGKTTMAPALWHRQIDAGALGITFATMWQVRTARALGARSVMLANSAVDARSLTWLSQELQDPDFRFVAWADSIETVEAMERGLDASPPPRPVDVCVELGAEGGRTGSRTIESARAVAERLATSPHLRLAGVGGYEGSLGHDRSSHSLSAVRSYLQKQVRLHQSIADLYDDGEIYLTAGGSAYFDLVAEAWSDVARDDRTHLVLRSGAYIVHDDGFYRQISPFDEAAHTRSGPQFTNAMLGYARVVSAPEDGLALVDAGKRDFPFDEGMPLPRETADDLDGVFSSMQAHADAMNDQHTYVRGDTLLPVGSVVRFGLSHPCTTFDKWRLIPVVRSVNDLEVIDLIPTFF